MAQNLPVTDLVTAEFLSSFAVSAKYLRSFTTKFDRDFTSGSGPIGTPKVGKTVNVKFMPRVMSEPTEEPTGKQEIDIVELPITIDHKRSIALGFSLDELTFNMDPAQYTKITQETARQFAADIEAEDAGDHYKKVWNVAGTAHQKIDKTTIMAEAHANLTENGLPAGGVYVAMSTRLQIPLADAIAQRFNPQSVASEALKGGVVPANTFDVLDFFSTPSIGMHRFGNRKKEGMTVNANVTVEGSDKISFTGVTGLTGTPTLNEGDTFHIEGVYHVHPRSHKVLGKLQDFVVKKKIDAASGKFTDVEIAPKMYSVAGSKAKATIDALPKAGAKIIMDGDENELTGIGLMYHREAIAFVNIRLPTARSYPSRWIQNQELGFGFLMETRRVESAKEEQDFFKTFYSIPIIRPEWASRIYGI